MGKLFNSIKQIYDDLANYQTAQEKDFLKETTFGKLYNNVKKISYLNFFINDIRNNAEYYFGSVDSFNSFLDKNVQLFPRKNHEIPLAYFEKATATIDVKGIEYEKILDAFEEKLGEKLVNELIEKYNKFTPRGPIYSNPLSDLTKKITNELDELNLSNEKIEEFKDALVYSKDELINKKTEDDTEKVIDVVNLVRDKEAKPYIKQYAEEIGSNTKVIESIQARLDAISFASDDPESKLALKPFVSHEPVYKEDFKKQILELDKFITEKGLIPNGAVGETGMKEYGFMDYFVKAYELKNTVISYNKVVDKNDKIQVLENISSKVKELKEVSNKYDEVINYIKENFDISKIGLNGNIYSGRKRDVDDLDKFYPSFPKKWDYENAGYSAILNGYAQLKGAAKFAGVSIEEYIENPYKCYLKGAKKAIQAEEKRYNLPRNDEKDNDIPLGKRIANLVVTDAQPYTQTLEGYKCYSRSIEFLNNVSEYDENTKKNMIGTAAVTGLRSIYDYNTSNLFFKDMEYPDYDSLQNLFALGNDTDNLMALAKNYFHDGIDRPDLDEPYELKIKVMHDVNPVNETRRVMEVLKDFMEERARLYTERKNDESTNKELEDQIEPAYIFVSAKRYMNDFIYKNQINLLSLDKKQREEVTGFLNDPIKAFVEKYQDTPNLLRTGFNGQLLETFDDLDNEFKKENDRLYADTGKKFVEAFNDLNNQTKGRNSGKSINEIIEANKGGYWERKFSSSSKEYKNLIESVKAATDPKSRSFGDLNGAKVYAQKYVDHKLPQGADFEKLSENEKRRVEFCHTIIGATLQMELNQKMEESNIKLSKDNAEFQNGLKKAVDLDLENNNEIEANNEITKENIVSK